MAFVIDIIHKFLLYWDIVKDNSCPISLCLTCYLPSKPPFLSGTLLTFVLFYFVVSMPRILNITTFESAFHLTWRVIIRGSIGSTKSATRVELIPVFNISGRRMKVGN